MAPRKPAESAVPPAARRSPRLNPVKEPTGPVVIDLTGESPARITKPKPAPKKPTRFACSTCGRKLAASSFPNRNCTDRCEHSMNTCKACTKTWISAQLESVTYDKLSCPECPAVMDNAHVKKLAAPKVYEKFDQMERRGIAEKIPGWRWCLNPKCRAGQVHKPLVEVSPNLGRGKRGKTKKKAADDICECDTCHAQACVSCDKPWDEGETCAQYQKRMKRQTETEEKATAKFIETKCKKCPNCSKSIEKNGGCDTVFCTQCRTGFCWLCTTPYSVINKSGHAKGCQYAQAGRFDPHAAPNAPGGIGVFGAVPAAVPDAMPNIGFFAGAANMFGQVMNGLPNIGGARLDGDP